MSSDLIHVLDRRVQLYQPEGGFRTSLDSVMLAAACPAQAGQSVLDLGCGVGSAGLCVLARIGGDVRLTGIEIQQSHVTLAQKNAAQNSAQESTRFICADMRDADVDAHDHVICNPPYLKSGAHTPSPCSEKALAMGHQDDTLDLEDWVACAFDHIKGQGSFTMIHAAGQIDRIIQALGRRFGRIEIIPLWPRAGVPAKRVIIRSWKHRKSESILYPGLILHQDNGDYTSEADAILRNAQALFC